MKKVATIISASWIYTANSQDSLLKEYSVVIDANKIIDLVSTEKVFESYEASEVFSLSDHILIPGLINTHSHSAMSLFKGYADDLKLKCWLNDYIWPAEKKHVSNKFVKDGSMIAIAEMLKGGITTFNDMYFFPESTAEAVSEMGIRSNIGLVVLEFSTNYANDPGDYLSKGFDFRDSCRENSLITTSIAPHAPYSVSDKTFEIIGTYAEQLNLSIHTHLQETQSEIEESIQKFGVTPIQRLGGLNILGPNLLAAHCVFLSEQDLDLLALNNVCISHNPSSNLKLGSGIADLTSMIEKGIGVSLGTDSSASNNRLDILGEMRLASLMAKGKSGNPEILTPVEVLRMATIEGAKALGLESVTGSIEKNKKADIVAINLDSLDLLPCYDPLSSLIYSAGRSDINYVWVDGNIKLKENELVNIDIDKLKFLAKSWQTKIQKT